MYVRVLLRITEKTTNYTLSNSSVSHYFAIYLDGNLGIPTSASRTAGAGGSQRSGTWPSPKSEPEDTNSSANGL